MKNWISKNYKALIIGAFLVPIITVAIVSISHVTKWYGISNPVSWAVYLSIGIEIAALSALAAISADMGKKVYFPFALVTLIQFIGNIFFAYSFIDINSQSFKDWVDLVSPLVSFMGVEANDFVGHKRFLAFFAGGMLPIISLSFLHMLVKFSEEDRKKEDTTFEEEKKHTIDDELIKEVMENYKKEQESNKIDASDLVGETSRLRLSEEDLKKLEEVLLNPPPPNEKLVEAAEKYNEKMKSASLKEEWALNDDEILKRAQEIQIKRVFEQSEEIKKERESEFGPDDFENEPTALANSQYRKADIEENINDWDVTLMDGLEEEEPFFTEKEIENIINEEITTPTPSETPTPILEEVMDNLRGVELFPESNQEAKEIIENSNIEDVLNQYQEDFNNVEDYPILSDEEIRDFNPIQEEPEEMSLEEIQTMFPEETIEEPIYEPTQEEEEQNFDSVVVPFDVVVDNNPEVNQVQNEPEVISIPEVIEQPQSTTDSDELVEKKNS